MKKSGVFDAVRGWIEQVSLFLSFQLNIVGGGLSNREAVFCGKAEKGWKVACYIKPQSGFLATKPGKQFLARCSLLKGVQQIILTEKCPVWDSQKPICVS